MYPHNRQFTIKVVIAFALLLIVPTSAKCMTPEDIFQWVLQELKMEESIILPSIKFVDKEKLHEVFRKSNEHSFQRWAEKYGSEQAEEIINKYLKEIIGLYDPKSSIVYVGSFLDSCDKETILAHELTHYIQDKRDGIINTGSWNSDTVHLLREMEAYNLDDRFEKTFCTRVPTSGRITEYGSTENIGMPANQ